MSAPYAAGAEPDHQPDDEPDDGPDDGPDDEPDDGPDDGPDDEPDDEPDDRPDGPDDLPEFAAAVLDVVDLVPPGQVVTYGDVAAFLGRGGPRQVGHVMSHWGGAVAWWRVLRADGTPAPGLEREAFAHYRRERTPLRPGGQRVDLRRARWTGGVGGL